MEKIRNRKSKVWTEKKGKKTNPLEFSDVMRFLQTPLTD